MQATRESEKLSSESQVVEHGPERERGFWLDLYQAGLVSGIRSVLPEAGGVVRPLLRHPDYPGGFTSTVLDKGKDPFFFFSARIRERGVNFYCCRVCFCCKVLVGLTCEFFKVYSQLRGKDLSFIFRCLALRVGYHLMVLALPYGFIS